MLSWTAVDSDDTSALKVFLLTELLSDFSPSKQRMQKVSNISIFVMYSMYFLAALFGYLTFKGESRRLEKEQITSKNVQCDGILSALFLYIFIVNNLAWLGFGNKNLR